MFHVSAPGSCLVALAAVTVACGDPAGQSAGEALFDAAHVVEIEIEIAPEAWDALRTQTRDPLDLIGEGCLERPTTSPFTYFSAAITIDGERFANVGVRKKGFYGSLSDTKPSLKVKLDHVVDGQDVDGIDLLTLNNNVSDPSQVKQCVGYRRFFDAGLPAPRCNLAVVRVNGVPLGTYSNVESIDRSFLRRHFDDDEGNLYEGALSDFRRQWVDTFENKTHAEDPDRSDLEALVAALEARDNSMAEAVPHLIDLERFYDFWALEVLLMHADGYARQTNNFYVYRPGNTGRFVFLPWGIDVILQPDFVHPWEEEAPPGLAWAEGALARRLYLHPPTRDRYLARVRTMLDEVWREKDIVEEVEQFRQLLGPHINGMPAGEQALIQSSIDDVVLFVRGRRAEITALLAGPPAVWDRPLRDSWCLDPPEAR